jgi:hypothetical protein
LAFDAVASLSALQQGIEIGMAATLMQSSDLRDCVVTSMCDGAANRHGLR